MLFPSWLRATCTPSSRQADRAGRRRHGARPRRARPALERLEDRLTPSAGQLDPTFGQGGIVTANNISGPTPTNARAVVVTQSDGKVVVAGSNSDSYGGGNRIAVVRYNADGSLDGSFGTNGEATFSFANAYNMVSPAGLAVDASGHIIVAGNTYTFSGYELAVARLNSDGSLDTTFGNGGKTVLPHFTASYESDTAAGVAVDSSGRIVLAGTASARFAVARLNADGSPDSSFGSGGETTVPSFGTGPSEYDSAAGVALDASGRLVLAGTAYGYISGNYGARFAVARLNADGSPDGSFGSGGETTVPSFGTGPSEYDSAAGVALDASGRLVLAGSVYDGGVLRIAVARLNADGSPDGSFGSGGETAFSYSTNNYPNDSAAGVAVDPSGHITVAGTTYASASGSYGYAFAVARLNGDGSLDSGFGSGGKTAVRYPGYAAAIAEGVALDAGGRAIVAGTAFLDYYSSPTMAVTRLNTDGSLDASWGSGGRVTTAVPGASQDQAANMTVTQPDGKIVVVGTSQPQAGNVRLAVTRYNADGTLDSTFGSGGVALFASGAGVFLYPSAVTLDGAGRVVIAGSVSTNQGLAMAVVRLNADGSPDTSLAGSGEALVPHFSPGSYESDTAAGVAIDSSGRIVLAGTASGYIAGSYGVRFAVARLNADGSPDSGFGSGGETAVPYGPGASYEVDNAAGLALDASGRIIVAGTALNFGDYSSGQQLAVTRLNADGSLDQGFGTGGKATVNFSDYYEYDSAAGVAIDPAGRIVVAGTTYYGDFFAVARLNAADGSLDQGFGTGGKATVSNFGPGYYYHDARRVAIDAVGRIAVVGSAYGYSGSDLAVALFEANGCPDVDFGLDGKVTTAVSSGPSHYASVAGAAFDAAGRLVVAGSGSSYYNGPTSFAVVRYLPHDRVVEAGSATFAQDLQSAVTALRTTPPPGTPRVVVHVATPAQMAAVGPALANLSVNPAGPEIEVLLDVDPGTYSLGPVSVPAGLKLVLDGDGGACGTRTLTGTNAPALAVAFGDVVIRGGMAFTENGNAPAILVQGGQVSMRNSTVTETTTTNQAAIAITGGQVDLGTSWDYYDPNYGGNTIGINGTGVLIRLTGPNNVMAIGDGFIANGNYLYDNYQIEDLIEHSLDGLGGGTVFWVPDNVYVTKAVGSVQVGVNVVPAGGTVNVQTGVKGPFYVGSKLLTIAYGYDDTTVTQKADTLDASKRELLVYSGPNNTVKFVAGANPGEVQLNINSLPSGTFLPTGRLVAYASYGDTVTVDSTLTLSAWLYGYGNCRLKGGGGNNVLIGYGGGNLLVGGPGRNVIIGEGNDRLVSNGGQDVLIAGSTAYDFDEVALGAILAEWSSGDSLATRIADITGDTSSPYFTANRLNGNYFLTGSGPNQTVFSDFAADTITAGSGPDLIFASAWDKVTGLTAADEEFIISG